MTEFQAKSIVDAVNRMFSGHVFSICVVDDCMKVTRSTRTAEYDSLRLYHCVHFSAMDKEAKAFVFRATLENVCNTDEFPAVKLISKSEEIESALILEHNSKPLMKRLFGIGR